MELGTLSLRALQRGVIARSLLLDVFAYSQRSRVQSMFIQSVNVYRKWQEQNADAQQDREIEPVR